VEWPAKRCYFGLVAVGVQEQAEDILVPPLLRNCLILMTFPLLVLSSPQNSGPCNSLYCLGKGKVFPYSLPSVGPGADPGVQAVSPQVT